MVTSGLGFAKKDSLPSTAPATPDGNSMLQVLDKKGKPPFYLEAAFSEHRLTKNLLSLHVSL